MKIQFLNGGLANQTFQYIFSRYYELSHPDEMMYLDDSYFALHTVHNGYELDHVFGATPHMLSEVFDRESWDYLLEQKRAGKSVPEILRLLGEPISMITECSNNQEFNPFQGTIMPIPANEYHPEILDFPGNVYYHGYWINGDWFRKYEKNLRQELVFTPITDSHNQRYLDHILSSHSVAIHIRRGDFVSLGLSYDIRSIRKLVDEYLAQFGSDWHLFVFSDDIDWCQVHHEELGFHLFQQHTLVKGNIAGQNYRDLQLMSQCQGMILSNSSFCYLAYLLNERKECVVNHTRRK